MQPLWWYSTYILVLRTMQFLLHEERRKCCTAETSKVKVLHGHVLCLVMRLYGYPHCCHCAIGGKLKHIQYVSHAARACACLLLNLSSRTVVSVPIHLLSRISLQYMQSSTSCARFSLLQTTAICRTTKLVLPHTCISSYHGRAPQLYLSNPQATPLCSTLSIKVRHLPFASTGLDCSMQEN